MHFPIQQAHNSIEILQNKAFKSPSIWELIKGLIRPTPRAFDCLQVEVTSHCAAKCVYCPHTTMANIWQGAHMDAKTFANLWPLLQQCDRVHLQGWGEPFLHPHFFDYVAFARKADCLVSSTSCALHLNENICKKVLKSGMDIVAFSLAGSDAQSNAARVGADFDKVCENIQNFQTLREKMLAVHVEVHFAYIMLADRMQAVLKLPELMHKLKVPVAVISTLDYVPSPELEALALPPYKTEELAKAKAILEEASAKAKEYDIQLYYALPSMKANTQCRENIQKSLYVSAQGDISPCVYLNVPIKAEAAEDRAVFGNVNKENALDIWQREDFDAFRQSHAAGCPSHALCASCVKRFETLDSVEP